MTTETTSEIVPVTPAVRVLASRTVMTLATLDDVARVASIAARSGLARCSKPEEAAIILMTGMELGLTPMQSLRGIYIVEGRPVLAADTMVAIVTRSGACRYWRTIETTSERCTIETQRVDDDTIYRRTWTMEDAKRAGLAGKGTWSKYPAAMLRHRVAADMAREIYAEILLGMYDPDEISTDGIDARPTTPRARADAPPPVTVVHDPAPSAQEPPQRPANPMEGRGIEAPAKTPAAPLTTSQRDHIREATAHVGGDNPTLGEHNTAVAEAEAMTTPKPNDITDAQAEFLDGFYARVAEIELPGECVAVWLKHREEVSTLPARERENSWKAIVSRCEEVGKMRNAKVWLKKAIAEEDQRRNEERGQKRSAADAPTTTEGQS